jgi:insertion element IS1 protein InsB
VASINVHCPRCQSAQVYRHGQNPKGYDRVCCHELLVLLTPFTVGVITRDDWGSYSREVPKDKHLTGKNFTQPIERNNLTLRAWIKRRVRKTICFSRSVELHEKVIGAFIEKYMFY